MTDPHRPFLIGLTGPAGSGKDTVAAYLEDDYGFCTVAFADPLRDMIGALLQHINVDGAWMVERDLKEERLPVIERSYRELAQSLGTGWGRDMIRQDLWVRIAQHRVGQILGMDSNAVLTDLRFPNEAAWVKAQGGTLVRIYRDGAPQVRVHSSETALLQIECDHELHNHGSKATLFDQVDALMDRLQRSRTTAPQP